MASRKPVDEGGQLYPAGGKTPATQKKPTAAATSSKPPKPDKPPKKPKGK